MIDRREFLRLTALSLGGLTASACADFMARQQAGLAPPTLALFESTERATLASVVDRILPRTDTPGALDAEVPAFIESVLVRAFEAEERDAYRAGLAELDASARAAHGVGFVALAGEQQDALLREIEARELAGLDMASLFTTQTFTAKPFFTSTKELTLTGYYGSQIAAGKEVAWSPFPGGYDGAVRLDEGHLPWRSSLG